MIDVAKIEDLNKMLSEVRAALDTTVLSSSNEGRLRNLNLVCSLVEERLAGPCSLLMDDNCFAQLNSCIVTVKNQVQQFVQQPNNPNCLTELDRQIPTLVTSLSRIPFALNQNGKVKSRNLLWSTYEKQLTNTLSVYENKSATYARQVDEAQTQLQHLEEQIKQKSTELSSLREQHQTDFQAELAERTTRFNTFLNQQNDAGIKQRTDFETALNAEKTNVSEKLKALTDKVEEDFRTKSEGLTNLLETRKTESSSLLEKIRGILGLVAEDALSGNSKKYANECKRSASRLFVGSIILMLLTAVISLFIVYVSLKPSLVNSTNSSSPKQEITAMTSMDREHSPWWLIIVRLVCTFPLLLPAWYCACEAKRKSNMERHYREMEVKLAAINPYLNEVQTEKTEDGHLPEREKAKIELLKFLMTSNQTKDAENVVIPKEIEHLLVEVVRKIPSNK